MQMTGRWQRTMRAVSMACLASVLAMAASMARAATVQEALGQAPADVEVVVVVPDLSQLSAKIGQLRQALNLPFLEMDDTLGSFKQLTGMTAGVNDHGSLLVVLPDLGEALRAEREPEVLMLVPVSDYNAFVGGFGGSADEDVTALTLPGGARQGFGRNVGEYAVLGASQEAVAGYEAGQNADAIIESVGAMSRPYVDQSDAVVYANFEKLAPSLIPWIDQAVSQATQQMEEMSESGFMSEAQVKQAKLAYEMYGSAAKMVIRDSRGWLGGMDLSDEGIGFTEALGIKPGSKLAGLFPGGEAATSLASLPQQPFIFALAMDSQAIALTPIYEAMAEAGGEAYMPAKEDWLPLVEKLKGLAMAFYAPDDMAMMSGSLLKSLSILEVENDQQYIADLKKYVAKLNGMEIPIAGGMAMDNGAGQGDQAMSMSYSTSYTDNALQLEGVQVDQYQLMTNMPPQLMQQMGPAAGFMQMFTNYSGYVAGKDGKVLATTVVDPQLVTAGFRSIEQGNGLGASESLKRIRDKALPPNPAAEAYISVSGIAQTANVAMAMFGMPPIEAPQDLAPIAMGLSSRDDSLTYRAYLPMETVSFLVQTGQNIAMMMGGAPGGPGAPTPGPGGPPPF